MSREEEEKRFYDLCYDAWMSGKNPDAVSWDRFDDCLAQGCYPDEININMMLPKRVKEGEDEQV